MVRLAATKQIRYQALLLACHNTIVVLLHTSSVARTKALHATALAHFQAVVEALKLVAAAHLKAVLDRPQGPQACKMQ